jgi:hypothetical protein
MPNLAHDDARALYALADDFDTARKRLVLSRQRDDGIPTLASASRQLTNLNALIADLSDEVLFRATDPGRPNSQERRAVGIFASAAVPATRALQQFAEAYQQLGFLHEYADHPATPDLTDVRKHAIAVVNDQLDQAQAALPETPHLLHTGADRLGDPPLRTTAARSRTTVPDAPAVTSDGPAVAEAPERAAAGTAARQGR